MPELRNYIRVFFPPKNVYDFHIYFRYATNIIKGKALRNLDKQYCRSSFFYYISIDIKFYMY